MRVRNDSGIDIRISLMGRDIDWKNGEIIELSEREWGLIYSDTEYGKASDRIFWQGLFHGKLPRLVPLKSKNPDIKESE